MAKRRAPTTPQSKLISDAMYAKNLSPAAIAAELGLLNETNVSFWASGNRPVPAKYTEQVAALLGLEPAEISTSYTTARAAVTSEVTIGQGDEARPLGLAIARLENDIHAINLAMGSIVSVMSEHRPAEAAELARRFRKLPVKFRDAGVILELAKVLPPAVGKAKVRSSA